MLDTEDLDRGKNKDVEDINSEDFGEQQPEEVATATVPEVEGAGDGDPQSLLANNLKAKPKLSFGSDVASSLVNDELLEKSGDDDAEDDSDKDVELVCTAEGTCGEWHGPVPRSGRADDGVGQLKANGRATRKVTKP